MDGFRDATLTGVDFTGATLRECDLTHVKIVGSQLDDVQMSGFGGELGAITIEGIDVTPFVEAQLDERYPERVQLRAIRTADDFRAMWRVLERLWSETVARADRLPESARHAQVAGEWSFAETLRHLAFAIDVWVGRMILDLPAPYHPLGLPPTDYPAADAAEIGIDVDAQPSFADAIALHADRADQVRGVLDRLEDAALDEVRTAAPAPAWGVESHSVADCLRVVMAEHCEHRRFALRDLAELEASRFSGQ